MTTQTQRKDRKLLTVYQPVKIELLYIKKIRLQDNYYLAEIDTYGQRLKINVKAINTTTGKSPLSRGGHFVSGDLKSFVYARLASFLSTRLAVHKKELFKSPETKWPPRDKGLLHSLGGKL